MDDLMREGMRGLGPAQIAAMSADQLRERGKPKPATPPREIGPDTVTAGRLSAALAELPADLPVEVVADYLTDLATLPRIEQRPDGPVVVIGSS